MSDNVELNAGSGGAILATDDVAGVQFQKVKLDVGGDGATAPLSTSNPMPVSDAGGSITVDGTVAVSGTVAVTDNSGSLTVDNGGTFAVQAAQSGTWNVGTVTTVTTVSTVTAVSDAQVQGKAAHDAAASGNPTLQGAYASAAAPSDVSADGDAVRLWALRNGSQVVNLAAAGALIGATSNALDVNIKSGASSGTQYTEDAAAAADPVGNALIMVRKDTLAALTSADGDNVAARGTDKGELYVKHSDAIPITDNAGSLTVDGTVSITANSSVNVAQVAGTTTDTNSGNKSAGTLRVVLATDQPALTNKLLVTPDSVALPANQSVNVSQINGVTPLMGNGVTGTGSQRVTIASDNTAFSVNATLQASTNTQEVVGDAAHDAAVAGNPVRIAGRARTSDYTAVANDDTADLLTTLNGKVVTQPFAIPELSWGYAAASGGITNTTGVTAKAAAGASVRNYVTRAQVINGHATVDTDVQIRDGASGTVLWRGFAKAAGGGVACDFDPPLRGTANTLIEVACGTTGTATYFNLQGYTGP